MRRLTLWPQSLFGQLLAASVIAVLLAQAVALFLIAQEREHFIAKDGSLASLVSGHFRRRVASSLLQPWLPVYRGPLASISADGQSSVFSSLPLPAFLMFRFAAVRCFVLAIVCTSNLDR